MLSPNSRLKNNQFPNGLPHTRQPVIFSSDSPMERGLRKNFFFPKIAKEIMQIVYKKNDFLSVLHIAQIIYI